MTLVSGVRNNADPPPPPHVLHHGLPCLFAPLPRSYLPPDCRFAADFIVVLELADLEGQAFPGS